MSDEIDEINSLSIQRQTNGHAVMIEGGGFTCNLVYAADRFDDSLVCDVIAHAISDFRAKVKEARAKRAVQEATWRAQQEGRAKPSGAGSEG